MTPSIHQQTIRVSGGLDFPDAAILHVGPSSPQRPSGYGCHVLQGQCSPLVEILLPDPRLGRSTPRLDCFPHCPPSPVHPCQHLHQRLRSTPTTFPESLSQRLQPPVP